MLKRSVHIFIIGLLAMPGLAAAKGTVQLPATNQTTCFDSKGNVRTCDDVGGVAWPAPRFIDKGDGTVNDKLTGLTWSKHANAPNRALPGDLPNACLNAEKDMIWLDALDFIACLNAKNHAGSKNWRLPNLNELESMVNLEFVDSSAYLNSSGFGFPGLLLTDVKSSPYWTATSDSSDTVIQSAAAAWEVDLSKGDSFSTLKNERKRGVWPVRDGDSSGPAQLRQTGQAGCFDDLGDTRPCATMGEDGEKLAGAVWPASRFQVNAGAPFAFDRVTGLIWSTATQTPGPAACADTGLNLDWQQALDHVACLNTNTYLGRSDWRLPNRKELQSLTDYSKGAPALPGGHPFNDKVGKTYWSATSDASVPRNARVVSMLDGTLSSAVKTGTLPVWPVSGPDLTPPNLTVTQGIARTKIASQIISGTVEAGGSVDVVVNGGAPVAATVNGTDWSFTIKPLALGLNNITVIAADFSENPATAAVNPITFIPPDGLISGGSVVSISDAMKALRIAVGLIQPSSDDLLRGDVAPLGAPDDRISLSDVLLILRKAVGLPSY